VVWQKDRGIDIEAFKDGQRWIIEAKGAGSRDQMRSLPSARQKFTTSVQQQRDKVPSDQCQRIFRMIPGVT